MKTYRLMGEYDGERFVLECEALNKKGAEMFLREINGTEAKYWENIRIEQL